MGNWNWEQIDPSRSGSAGDISKLFRNESVKRPGVFAENPPPANATVLAREAIQNSWDAARDLDDHFTALDRKAPRFVIRFRYTRVSGRAKQHLVEQLDLRGLRDRANAAGDDEKMKHRARLGLAQTDCLDHLDGETPLDLLVVEERGASGMYGSWDEGDSRMYLALVSVGITEKALGSGGSYGYGKAGLIRGSRIHSVIAYTCFPPSRADGGVTRRALGMTYWGPHQMEGGRFNGFARVGETTDGVTRPLENLEADKFADSLGLAIRDPDTPDNLGSSFLLIDPTVEPGDLCHAIEQNWWPAIIEGDFRVEIEKADGEVIRPRPKSVPILRPFIRGYELATQPQDNSSAEEHAAALKKYKDHSLGRLGLVADMGGWSYAKNLETESQTIRHRSLVALTRSPRMIVEYLDAGSTQPYVRGTFVADNDVDDLLRQTEPKAHDEWQNRVSEEGINPLAPKVADEVRKNVRSTVRTFMKRLKPPPVREQDVRLPLLDNLLKSVLEGHGKAGERPPTAPPRPLSIGIFNSSVEPTGDGSIRASSRVMFALTDKFDEPSARCRIRLRYVFDEDGRVGDDCPIEVTAPVGWSQLDTKEGAEFEGNVFKEQTRFEIRTAPYNPDWSVQLIARGDLIESSEQTADGGGTE